MKAADVYRRQQDDWFATLPDDEALGILGPADRDDPHRDARPRRRAEDVSRAATWLDRNAAMAAEYAP